MNGFKEAFHRMGFWFLIVILIGMIIGGYSTYRYNKWQMQQSILLGGYIYNGIVYNISPR